MTKIVEVYFAMKRLGSANTKSIKELLQNDYSPEWNSKSIDHNSQVKTITRQLDILVEMGLLKKEKRGRENIYTIESHYPVQSNAPEYMEELHDILKEDETLLLRAQKSLQALSTELKSPYYLRPNTEDIHNKEKILLQLEHAIKAHHYIEINYKNKIYNVQPLKIAEFEGIWYLLLYIKADDTFRKYRIIEIETVEVLKETFTASTALKLKLSTWHNVWHDPNKPLLEVKLWLDKQIMKYIYQKNIFNINSYPERVRECPDGFEYYVEITTPKEILAEIMYWQPQIIVLDEPKGLNLKKEIKQILQTTLSKY